MKKASIKLVTLLIAVSMLLSMTGCGQTVVEESIWVEGEGTTQTITHSSGTSSAESTEEKDDSNDKKEDSNSEKDDSDNKKEDSGSKDNGSDSKKEDTGSDDKKESGKDNDKKEESDKTNSPAIDEDDRTTDEEEIKDKDSDIDLKGAEIVIAGWGENGREIQPSSPYYKDWKKMTEDIEKKYNCKLKYKTEQDSMAYQGQWVTAAQSGVKFADIVTLASSWPFPLHMKQGYLHPLDDYLDLSEDIYNKGAVEAVAYGGKHYLTIMIDRVYVGQGLVFNPDIFEQYGAKTPHEYIEENNWTFDTYLEVAQKITSDSNNKVYGMDDVSITTYAGANGGKMVTNKNGKYTFTAHTDKKFLDGAQFAHDLLNKYKVVGGDFKKGTAAMSFCSSYNTSDLDAALGSGNWCWAYIPTGWDVKAGDYQIEVTETTSFGIPSTVKNPDAIAQIMYDFNYPYKWKTSFEEESEAKFGDETSYNIYLEMGYKGLENHNLAPLYDYIDRKVSWGGDGQNMGLSSDASKVKAPQVYFSEVAKTAQAELDSIWDQ